ncbi:MAG TPA: right-handed parallel beta-helix repeat-containing protein [Bdellovibrionales bacterium]|nr:right-handed parallel beta-helix repeat-containing protein [Bdellovibrionales bacterium]
MGLTRLQFRFLALFLAFAGLVAGFNNCGATRALPELSDQSQNESQPDPTPCCGDEAPGNVFYVSAQGDDSNTGTSQASPWATIAKVNATRFTAGASVLFRGGDTFDGSLSFDQDDAGTAAQPIVVRSYGTGRATIRSGLESGVTILNRGGFVVRDLNFKGSGRAANTGSGVHFLNDLPQNTKLGFVRVERVDVSGFGKHGIAINGAARDGSKSGYRDVRITYVNAFDNAHTGVLVRGYWDETSPLYANSDVYLGYIRAYANTGVPGYTNHSGSGILLQDVDGGVIEFSVAYDNGALSDNPTGGPVGIWAAVSNNVKIQFNESHHNTSAAKDGGGFDLDGGTTNSVVQYNYSHDNKGAGFLVYNYAGAPHRMDNLTLRYNISQNDGSSGMGAIQIGGVMAGPVRVYNNTIYSDGAVTGTATKSISVQSANVSVHNNIFAVRGGVRFITGATNPNTRFIGNAYWASDGNSRFVWGTTTYTSASAFATATGQEMLNGSLAALTANPMFTAAGSGPTYDDPAKLVLLSNYKLSAASMLAGAGLDLKTLYGIDPGPRDFYGSPSVRGGAPEVGAHELP